MSARPRQPRTVRGGPLSSGPERTVVTPAPHPPTPSSTPTVTATPDGAPHAAATDPLTQLWDTVTGAAAHGPHAVMRLLGHGSGAVASAVVWVAGVAVATLLLRVGANRLIARLTRRLSEQGPRGAWARVLHRLARRSLRGLPSDVVTASITAMVERRQQRAQAIGSLLRSLVSGLLGVLALLLVATHFGVPGGAVFSAGLLGVGVAVLTQGIARDVLAGLFVLVEDTYGVGDFVDVTLGASGIVEAIGLRTTRLRGADGTVWHVRHSEMVRIGNRTQEQTLLLTDVTVTCPDIAADVSRAAGAAELAQAERLVRRALDRLDRDLLAAHRAASPEPTGTLPGTLVEIVADLVPDAPAETLSELADQASDAAVISTQPMPDLAAALEELLEDADLPLLAETTVVGLTNAGRDFVTLRVRARVTDTSREQALAALRRRLFLDLTAAGLAVSFAPVDPSAL